MLASRTVLSALFALVSAAAAAASPVQAPTIDVARELMITDHLVLDDARASGAGAWSFGTLMTRLSGSNTPSDFVEHWFDTLVQPQVVNGVTVFHQAKSDAFNAFRQAWRDRSAAVQPGGPSLLMRLAPFRLLAIVNRPDLVKVGPGGVEQYGEGRFVYGAYDIADPTHTFQFFVIFEYGLPATSCTAVSNWAASWHALSNHAIDSAAYRAALQTITDSFTLPSGSSSKPNGSLLNQLRTNEIELGTDFVWDLREWNLVDHGTPGLATLDTVTTKQTPHFDYLKSSTGLTILGQYLTQTTTEILAGIHIVPDFFQTTGFGTRTFQGGDAFNACNHLLPHPIPCTTPPCQAQCDFSVGTRWWAPGYRGQPEEAPVSITTAEVRHKFALQTCSGCHFQETGTTGFVMVSGRQVGQEATLSKFLTGIGYPIADPVIPNALDAGGSSVAVSRSFNELAARTDKLVRMLGLNCSLSSAIDELKDMEAEMGTRVH